ncbi:MAG: fructose-bisphosphate aldolase [Thermoplasmata archaeon]|nr:fructose-bisphosphate aldolase [Thermoplasmata archaeon]
MYGKDLRLRRLFWGDRRLFAVPLDHSVSMGPIDGLESTANAARELQAAGADLLIVTKGAAREVAPLVAPPTLLGIHVSASTNLGGTGHRKVKVGTAAEAVGLGADLLSVQVNFGVPEEPEMLRELGEAVDECRSLGLPLLCMAYVKKPGPPSADELRHAARASADLGADIVKSTYPGSVSEFRSLVERTPVPVLIGGGVRIEDDEAFLTLVRESLDAGGAGICIGRNLFQRRPIGAFARRVAAVVHGTP